MTGGAERFARIKELLLQARDQPESSREQFVRDAAGEDAALADEVLSLLGHEERPARIVAEGVLPVADPPQPRHPEQIGPYRILGVLGEGGMGVVYRAVQEEPIHREVALKLVRRGLDTERVLRRFHWERQSLARLDHPNIASVLDAGDADGRPWFVMSLVEGRPITRFCDEERLDVAARVALFDDVCRAVQHAHQRGLLHRDLKPGNILVRRVQGLVVPTIIDFGIARSLQPGGDELAQGLTLEGQRIGTPAYMSPEQLHGADADVDTRSDVYSLGVILYELLAGRHPWVDSGETAPAVDTPTIATRPSTAVDLGDRQARAHERASTARDLVRKLRGDLDTICLMALRHEPERRYASAAHLADDLLRYRRGEPVLARPDSWRYRAGKFMRRHPAGMVAAALVVLLIAGSGGFLAWHAQRLELERDRAVVAESKAQAEAAAAQSMVEFLEGIFLLAQPGGEGGAGDLSMQDLLDQGVRRVPEELAGEPLLQVRMLRALAQVYHSMNQSAAAESLLVEALAMVPLVQGLDSADRANLRGALHSDLGAAYHDLGRLGEAEAHDRLAVGLYREAHSGDHPDLSEALNGLGISIQAQGRVAEGIGFVRESLEMQERLADGPDAGVAWGWGTLGYLNFKLGHLAESRIQLERALALAREVFAGQDHFELLYALNNYGGLCEFLDDLDEAEPVLREALEMCQRMYADSEHAALGRAYQNLARVRRKRGDLADAQRLFDLGHGVVVRTSGVEHPRAATSFQNLARLALAQGDFALAEQRMVEVARIRAATVAADHPAHADTGFLLGQVRLEAGRPREALPHLTAYHEFTAAGEPNHYSRGLSASWLGQCLLELGRAAEAKPLLEEGHRILESALGADHSETRAAARRLAGLPSSG